MSILYSTVAPATRMWFHSISRLKVSGRENVPQKGPLIVVANHLSTCDPPILGSVFPRQISFMAKDELFRFPSGLLMHVLGAFSARKFGRSGMALRQAVKSLENGRVLGIFPEGKRSFDQQLNNGEIGAAFIALRSGVPVIPVGFSGSEYLERKPSFLRRPPVTVTIGKPFSFQRINHKISKDHLIDTTDRIMQNIAQVLPQSYRGIYDRANQEF